MASFQYNIEPSHPDSHQEQPSWAMVVVRLKNQITFDRNLIVAPFGGRGTVISKQEMLNDLSPVAEASPLLLTSRVQAFNITATKGQPTMQGAFTLAPGLRLENLVHAGDWVLFWAWDNQQDADRYTQAIRRVVHRSVQELLATPTDLAGQQDSGQHVDQQVTPAGFLSGLKFVGKCSSPKLQESVTPATGQVHSKYLLTAVGFGEFETSIYYHPVYNSALSVLEDSVLAQQRALQANLDAALQNTTPQRPGTLLGIFLNVFLGLGPGEASKGNTPDLDAAGNISTQFQDALQTSQNSVYLVPRTVAKLLGVTPSATGARYVDLLSTFIGIQGSAHGQPTNRQDLAVQQTAPRGMAPQRLGDLDGEYVPQLFQFSDRPLWGLLQQVSAAPVNEMYTTLRCNAEGRISPTFVCRQTPYSSRAIDEVAGALGKAAFPFVDLPRWVLSPKMTEGGQFGASDQLRCNMVQVQGQVLSNVDSYSPTLTQQIDAPFMVDLADIRRNGLRTKVMPTQTIVDDLNAQGAWYTALLGDINIDAHLRWSGSISTRGIQEPVALGEILEYRGVIYEIAGLTHSGQVAPDGKRKWSTSFNVTSGLSAISDIEDDNIFPSEVAYDDPRWVLLNAPLLPSVTIDEDGGEGVVGFDEDEILEQALESKSFGEANTLHEPNIFRGRREELK